MRRNSKDGEDDQSQGENAVSDPKIILFRRTGETFIPIGKATNAVVLRLSSRLPRIKCERPGEEDQDARR